MPCKTDPAAPVIDAVAEALLGWFAPNEECPPAIGAVDIVRFLAGDGIPLSAWNSVAGCDNPFAWVRVMSRYRSSTFPTPTTATNPCGLPRVIAIEVGVAWCAVTDQEPRWDDWAAEAAKSLDTSWRLEEALCAASKKLDLAEEQRQVGTSTLTPYGPDGDAIGWTGIIYASL